MKKMLWAVTVIAIISFIVWSGDPLNDAVNFIIGGNIPGTKTSIGFLSTMGITAVVLFLVIRGYKNARDTMLSTALDNNRKENAKKEFEEAHSIEFDHSKRSVISAKSSETTA